MPPRSVVSPARELIEIVPDAEWLELTGAADQAMRQMTARLPLLGALWTQGTFKDESGLASAPFHAAATALGYKAGRESVNDIIRKPVMTPAIRTRTKGKRRYEIGLQALPESWYQKVNAHWPHVNGSTAAKATGPFVPVEREALPDREAAETVAAMIFCACDCHADSPDPCIRCWDAHPHKPDVELPPPDEPLSEYAPPIDLTIASSVAMALLTQVVEIVSAGTPADTASHVKRLEADLSDVADKLARRLAENDNMRKSIREMGDEVMALRAERDGLRKRLRATEANLEAATNADAMRAINDRVQTELAKVMRTAPVHKAEGDE